jgi:CRP/FNR family transcriptional regulator
MPNVVSITDNATRCAACRIAADCPLSEDPASASDGVGHSRLRVLHAGDRLFRTGDRVDALYRVRTGIVKSTLSGHDGVEQVTGFHGAGEWVGLDALDGERYRSEAVALDTASVCVVPYPVLRERIGGSSRAARLMVAAMSQRLANKEAIHLSLARDNAAQRLAAFLLDIVQRREAAGLDATQLALPMSRGEIASYLALAVETVSRLFTRLHRAGIVCVHRHHVEIKDHAALARSAGRMSTPAPLRAGSRAG